MAKKTNKKKLRDNSKTKKIIKKKKKRIYPALIITAVIIVVIAYIFYINKDILFEKPSETLITARVNGEEIALNEVNEAYDSLSDEYKILITKEEILDEIINERLLLQEAEKQGITATKKEAIKIIDDALTQSTISEEEFKTKLDSLQISRDHLNEYYQKQLIISRLLNETLFKKIIILDTEIEQFYERNELALQNITLEDSIDEIKDFLVSEKKKSIYLAYLSQLKSEANIEIFLDKPVPKILEAANIFEEPEDSICKKDNKPIIRFYSTTYCQSCMWIKETFDSFAEEYKEKIIAYHWELNTGDNTLTEEIEGGIPKSELDIFRKYNPKSTVPTFIFGCKYVRIGNAYENQNNLDAEKQEFETIADKLVS